MITMDKTKLQTLKGFRDFLPDEAEKREFLIEKTKEAFELYGFQPIETPALEYQEVLLGKYGQEADKLVYTFEDKGGRSVALRYDQTVPTARVLAQHQQNLPMPFRRYQIQPVWRAEKPQSGRYREFLQCDADIYGTDSVLADAEIISLSHTLCKLLGFEKFKIYINDRDILFELINYASIPESLQFVAIAAIDKLDRKSKDEVKEEMLSHGISDSSIDHLFHHLSEAKPTDNLTKLIKLSETLGVDSDRLVFQARLARGLDYYTGTIFEIKVDDYTVGSILGGGRYDKLIGKLSGTDIPAVGFALGFDRTIEAMHQLGLFPETKLMTNTLVTIFNSDLLEMSIAVVKNLRENKINAELFPNDKTNLRKQIKYADKRNVKWLIVIGPDEVKNNTVILKNMQTGDQKDVPLKKLVKVIKENYSS